MKWVGLALVACATGCIPALHEEHVNSAPHADADAERTTDRKRETAFSSTVADGALTVSVTETPWCRDTTPMGRDSGTRRHLDGGALSYVVNGVGAVVLAGVGIGLVAAPCNGCTPQQTQTVQLTGGLIAALAAVPIGLIIWNAVRSGDDVTTVPVHMKSEWMACGKAVAAKRKSVRIVFADGKAMRQVTDNDGDATFDFSDVTLSDVSLNDGSITVSVAGTDETATASLRGVAQYDRWQQARADQARDQAAQAQAARDAQQRQTAHDAALKRLQDVEHAIGQSGPPWTDERLITFSNMLPVYDAIDAATLAPDERKRYDQVTKRRDSLAPSYEQARSAAIAQAQKATLQIGRAIVLSMLKAPSTAHFVGGDTVLFQCASGVVMTEHEVDAQNGFGAMIRERYCPKFDPVGRRVYLGPGSAAINLDCIQSFGSMGGLAWTRQSFCQNVAAELPGGGRSHLNPSNQVSGGASKNDWEYYSAPF